MATTKKTTAKVEKETAVKETAKKTTAKAEKETAVKEPAKTATKKTATKATAKAAEKTTEEPAKKAPAKKAPAKKAAPKKVAPKKPATVAAATAKAKAETAVIEAPVETKVNFFVEFGGVQVSIDEVIKNIKATNGKDAKEISVYLKPEESKAYFVADGEEKEMDVFFC